MATKEIAAAMYAARYSGENDAAAENIGKALVSKGDLIVVDSFLQDRPPPFVDVPQEEAEIRVGQKSNFQFDSTVGDTKNRKDFIISDPKFGGVTWPDPPPLDDQEDTEDDAADEIIKIDIYETDRIIEVIRVQGSDGESWVDVERINEITFRMPQRNGPKGTITEYWTYHLNNSNPVINGVDVGKLELDTGDQIISVEDAP